MYERLLQRLALALDEAESDECQSAGSGCELELRDLTLAELELIRAYQARDLNWLRGWHAAAEELAVIEHWPKQAVKRRPLARLSAHRQLTKSKPLTSQRVQLCCALCGVVADWQATDAVHACRSCGSQLFRARNPR
ncbi:hypothetical protein AB5S05_15190 [Pseudomonas sp. 25A3E]|uniref:Zinc-ribbon containing domain-containing protein n=1 Tax=Pseudomonas zhanjiangensis TaxID=3239015 RepID=A0ABV3YXW9_9PSED